MASHISGHPSAAGRAQDRESSPARDRRSTTEPRHQQGGDGILIIRSTTVSGVVGSSQQQHLFVGGGGGERVAFAIFIVRRVEQVVRHVYVRVRVVGDVRRVSRCNVIACTHQTSNWVIGSLGQWVIWVITQCDPVPCMADNTERVAC